MLFKKLFLLLLVVQANYTNEFINTLVPSSNSGDILYIQDILNGVSFSYFQKVQNKQKQLEYVQKIDPQKVNCSPNTLKLYQYDEGNIQYSIISTYTFTDNIHEKFIDLGSKNVKIPVSAIHKCNDGVLNIYLFYPGRKMQNVAIKMQNEEEFYQLNVMEDLPNNKQKLKKILQEANQTMEKIEEFELLYVYKFKYNQAKSYNIQFQLNENKTFENNELVVPKIEHSMTDYLIYNNKIQVLYLAVESYENPYSSKPSSNDFSKDETFKNSVLFQYSLNIDSEGIKVSVQSIQIGQNQVLEKNHFINCQSDQKTIDQITQSEIMVIYKLQQSNGTQTYTNQALKSQKGQYIQDFQYVFSDIPFEKQSTTCNINIEIKEDQDQTFILNIEMNSSTNKFKNYRLSQNFQNKSQSELEQAVEFNESLNSKLKDYYLKAPHIQIENNEIFYNNQGQSLKCDKIFDSNQEELSESFNKLQILNYTNTSTFYPQKLQWFNSEGKLISHLYFQESQPYQVWQLDNVLSCKLINALDGQLQIALSSNEKQLYKYRSDMNQGQFQVEVYNQENEVVLSCQKQLETQLPQKYNLYYQYTQSGELPQYFRFYAIGSQEPQLEIFEEDFLNITENKNCFIDDTVIEDYNYLEVVFYDKPSIENALIHYIKAYFLKNEIKLFEVKSNLEQNNLSYNVESKNNSNYANKNQVWVIKNFNEETQQSLQWEQLKNTSVSSIPQPDKVHSYQKMIYFNNKVIDKNQSYLSSFYQKDQEEKLYYLITIKNNNQLQLGEINQNKKMQFNYWIVLIFERNDYTRMQLTAYDLYNGQGNTIFKDQRFENIESFKMNTGDQYEFQISDLKNKNLLSKKVKQQVNLNEPVVLLLLPMVSQNNQFFSFKSGSIDNNQHLIKVKLKISEYKII